MTTSVVIPNCNHAEQLKISLEAIVTQTLPVQEIIIIDDASTDHSLDVISGFQARYSNIRLLRNTVQQGVATTVARGLAEVRTPRVLLASADEKILPHMNEVLGRALDAFPQARVAVGSYCEWFPHQDNTVIEHGPSSALGMWYADEQPRFIDPARLRALLGQRFVWLPVNSAVFDIQALREVGGFDPALRWHSDWFAMYAIAFRYGFCAVNRPVSWFRIDPKSYSGKGMSVAAQQREVALAIQRKLQTRDFRDFERALRQAPCAMSPFIRPMIQALSWRPRYYGMLVSILKWWCAEVFHGRRPGILRRWVERLTQPKGRNT